MTGAKLQTKKSPMKFCFIGDVFCRVLGRVLLFFLALGRVFCFFGRVFPCFLPLFAPFNV